MKKKIVLNALGAVCGFLTVVNAAYAQGTAFTYQGQLDNGTNPVTGLYNFKFDTFSALTGGSVLAGPVTNTAVPVTNGLFTTVIDFGPGIFTGPSNWLHIQVTTNGGSNFVSLAPRQQLTPTPYAIYAAGANAAGLSGTIPAASISGTYGGALNLSNANNTIAGNGSGLTGLNAASLTTGTVPDGALAADVALTDASQTFVGTNVFITGTNSGSRLIVRGSTGIDTTLFSGLGFQYDSGSGAASIISSFNDGFANLSFYTKQGAGYPFVKQVTIGRYGDVVIDQQEYNSGQINSGNTNGVGLTFGSSSGEGIASQRTPGINQYGLDFYTSYNHRMSILNNGYVGINNTNPLYQLDVAGTINATHFNGNGGGITNLSVAALPNVVVTNNEPNVSLGNLTLGGSLNLSFPATIDVSDTPLLYADNNGNEFFGWNGIGEQSNGGDNTGIGYNAMAFNSGSENTAVGMNALYDMILTCNNNIGIGYGAGASLQSGNNDIYIGNPGANESGIIRIGKPGTQTSTYLAGNVALNGGLNIDQTGTYGSNSGNVLSNALTFGTGPGGSGEGIASQRTSGPNQFDLTLFTGFNPRLTVLSSGYVGIGLTNPSTMLEVNGAERVDGGALYLEGLNGGSFEYDGLTWGTPGLPGINGGYGPFLAGYEGGALGGLSPNTICLSWDDAGDIWVSNNCTVGGNCTVEGNSSVATLTIRGGSDLAEPFNIVAGNQEIPQGAVVVIDDQNPGQLKLSDRPYDTRVAGIVSGANGIHPGIQMHQQGLLEGGKNVALTGRVYVQADATNGAIRPGDMLTTSSAPGRAMKVTDHAKATGAILGKAMTGLSEGEGMVLVLVTLQ